MSLDLDAAVSSYKLGAEEAYSRSVGDHLKDSNVKVNQTSVEGALKLVKLIVDKVHEEKEEVAEVNRGPDENMNDFF
eukprot:831461-Rhodomonas_salina.1